METLDLMNALQDAWRILDKNRSEVAAGTLPVYQKLRHAQNHLDNEMRLLLAEDSSPALPSAADLDAYCQEQEVTQ